MDYIDVLADEQFRKYVEKRIGNNIFDPSYCFPITFPILNRYTKFREYSVKDIISTKVTITNIGEFNDIFDGAMHEFNSLDEIKEKSEKEWAFLKEIYDKHNISLPESNDKYIENSNNNLLKISQNAFSRLDYLGVFVCCFSTSNDSTLMWSHYADSNCGMCITYDFNKLNENDIRRQHIFPLAYSHKPIIIPKIDHRAEECEYPVEANILCTALSKGLDWNYEKEWRLVHIFPTEKRRRFSINIGVKPSEICFGYHFMKPFFYDDQNNMSEASEKIALIIELLTYMVDNNIKASIIIHAYGEYKLLPTSIEANELKKFIEEEFKDNKPQQFKYYHVLQKKLLVRISKV